MSDMAGYAARVAVERSGSCRDTMEPRGRERPTFAEATSWHRIDGKTDRSTRAGAHESISIARADGNAATLLASTGTSE